MKWHLCEEILRWFGLISLEMGWQGGICCYTILWWTARREWMWRYHSPLKLLSQIFVGSKLNKKTRQKYFSFTPTFKPKTCKVFQRPSDTAFRWGSEKCMQERSIDGCKTQQTRRNPWVRKSEPLVSGSWRAVPGDPGLTDYLDFSVLPSASASGYSGDWMVGWKDLCSDPV